MPVYQPLPRSDPESITSNEDIQTKPTLVDSAPAHSKRRFSTWAVIACIVCTIANLSSIFIFPPSSGKVPQSVAFLLETPRLSRQAMARLRRPSQFVGLDRIHRHLSTDVKPFVNKPILSSQIDASNPEKCFYDEDARQRSLTTPIGTVFLEHYQIAMTPTVSTVMQFHSLDYAMEACELRISLPASPTTEIQRREEEDDGDGGESSFRLSDLPVSLRLSQLDMPYALDATTVSYRTQPPLLRDVADFHVTELPATFSHNFTCKMEEVFTFKLGCLGPNCHVEWLQKGEKTGVTLIQHSSL